MQSLNTNKHSQGISRRLLKVQQQLWYWGEEVVCKPVIGKFLPGWRGECTGAGTDWNQTQLSPGDETGSLASDHLWVMRTSISGAGSGQGGNTWGAMRGPALTSGITGGCVTQHSLSQPSPVPACLQSSRCSSFVTMFSEALTEKRSGWIKSIELKPDTAYSQTHSRNFPRDWVGVSQLMLSETSNISWMTLTSYTGSIHRDNREGRFIN